MNTPRSTHQPLRPEITASRRVRDPYADLLRDTRGLRREQAAARDAWFAGITLEHKEEALFELEMLLKGVVAWGNARNHPARGRRAPLAERDFHVHLTVVRASVARCLALTGELLGGGRRPLAIARQLPSVFSDEPRVERVDAPAGETPDAALHALSQSLRVTLTVLDGLLEAPAVPYRLFYAAVVSVQREVARNPFFNPLYALEFRPEFDRVRVPEVLDAVLSVEGEVAHRLVALACLGPLRLQRMTALLQTTAADPDGVARVWPLAAALRADARVLAGIFQSRAASMLADSMERELMRVPAVDMRARYDAVARDCERLGRLRAVMHAAAAALRAETRRLTEVTLPPCDAPVEPGEVAAAVQSASAQLRDALQTVVVQVTWALRGGADPDRLFPDRAARRVASERLRQQAWMFSVVTRAFVASAASAPTDDAWEAGPSLGFARDYLHYFRALGQVVAHETDYPHTERLTQALSALRESDWVDATRLAAAVEEAEAFQVWLRDVVERVGERDELRGVPLDKHAAGDTLRLYLGQG